MTILGRIFIGLAVLSLVLTAGASFAVTYSYTSFDGPAGTEYLYPMALIIRPYCAEVTKAGNDELGFLKVGKTYTSLCLSRDAQYVCHPELMIPARL